MKKTILTILVTTLFCCSAPAQWYLFRSKNAKKETPSEVPVPAVADTVAATADTLFVEPEVFILDIPEEIRLTLILPLVKPSTSEPNSSMYDFYSGAALAVKEWGQRGKKIRFSIIDSWNCGADEIKRAVADGDIVIYAADSLNAAARLCEKGKCIVSPLSPVDDRDSLAIVQVAVPWRCQIDNLAGWIAEDTKFSDEIIILDDRWPKHRSDTLEYLAKSLDNLHKRYRIESEASDRSGLSLGTTRFVCVSNNNKYLGKVIQNIASQGENGNDVCLYSTSRIRNLRGMEDSEAFYNAGCRIAAQYAVDYNDGRTVKFIEDFRDLGQCEPGRFAFHGYDVVNCFVSACSQYGRFWKMKLDECPVFCGIQSEFNFSEGFDKAMTNTACSRIIYNKDLTISVIR